MNKKVIRLTESDLHRIVKESVNIILEKDELGLLDRIERALPWTDAHKLHKKAKDIRARREAEMAEYDKQKRRERRNKKEYNVKKLKEEDKAMPEVNLPKHNHKEMIYIHRQ